MNTGWRSRGYIPHLEAGAQPQFVTFRLFDSLPNEVLDRWRQELNDKPADEVRKELLRRIGGYLDEGHGCCLLRNPVAAKIVHDAILFLHGRKYSLHAWVVMPNHGHLLFSPMDGHTLDKILHSLKSYTVHEINRQLGREGQLWQEEYYDELVAGDDGMERVRLYIEWNPVKAGLCFEPKAWAYSSANEVARRRIQEQAQGETP